MQAQELIDQLHALKTLAYDSLIENKPKRTVNQESYYQRNSQIINQADELIAFWVNQSDGTLDTINKAKK